MAEINCYIRTKDDKREHGFIVSGSWTLFLGNVWDGWDGEEIPYKSEKELLNDGWEID